VVARNSGSPRNRFQNHPLVERCQSPCFNDLPGCQIGGAHLDGVRTQHGGQECGLPIEDSPGKNHATVLKKGRHAPPEVHQHLRMRERAVLSHVAAGLISLADHILDTGFQGEPQQGLIRSDIHDPYAAFDQLSYRGKIAACDHDKTGSMFLYPGQLRFPERVFQQRDDIHGIRTPGHDLRQASQLAVKRFRVHQAKSDGGQASGIGNACCKLRDIRNPAHGALDKGVSGSHLFGHRAVQKAILFCPGQVAYGSNFVHEGFHGRFGLSAKTLNERRGKGSFHAQRDDLVLTKMALQRMEGAGIHPVNEGAAAFLHILCAVKRVLKRLDLPERQRVTLVEQTAGNMQVQADQTGGIQAEFGELLALKIIDDHQICQPVDALENNPGCPNRQECRCRLRGGDASPDENVERR